VRIFRYRCAFTSQWRFGEGTRNPQGDYYFGEAYREPSGFSLEYVLDHPQSFQEIVHDPDLVLTEGI
jgi:hypothetical protein